MAKLLKICISYLVTETATSWQLDKCFPLPFHYFYPSLLPIPVCDLCAKLSSLSRKIRQSLPRFFPTFFFVQGSRIFDLPFVYSAELPFRAISVFTVNALSWLGNSCDSTMKTIHIISFNYNTQQLGEFVVMHCKQSPTHEMNNNYYSFTKHIRFNGSQKRIP